MYHSNYDINQQNIRYQHIKEKKDPITLTEMKKIMEDFAVNLDGGAIRNWGIVENGLLLLLLLKK